MDFILRVKQTPCMNKIQGDPCRVTTSMAYGGKSAGYEELKACMPIVDYTIISDTGKEKANSPIMLCTLGFFFVFYENYLQKVSREKNI